MTQIGTAVSLPAPTLWQTVKRFKGKISLTMLLVVAESALDLLFPLFIGFAINGLLAQSYSGVLALGGLGLAALIVGSGRRFYDTRAYAAIYTTLSTEMVAREQDKESNISTISARASLLTEFVEFLENSMPGIITSIIGLVGILGIIFSLNIAIFVAALGLLLLMILVYVISGRWNFRYNKGYNDALEEQVDVLTTKDMGIIGTHFKTVMRWNIKLSDLETVNYAAIWLGIIGLLVYAPIAAVASGVSNFGLVFSILMYVFQYVESVVTLPLFIQQLIRLQEISQRLGE
ncbi:MAG: ABC transporter six-transmembrane domain-containing protein [Chloroflexota bacterium]